MLIIELSENLWDQSWKRKGLRENGQVNLNVPPFFLSFIINSVPQSSFKPTRGVKDDDTL